SSDKLVVLFGGASGSNLFADTWIWDGTEWTQVADTGPAARSGHSLAYDSARNRLVLFGGRTETNPVVGDTWAWDGTEWPKVQTVGPPARRAHGMACDPTASRVVLFGGAVRITRGSTTHGCGTGRIGRRPLIPGQTGAPDPPWLPPRPSFCSAVLTRSIRIFLRLTASSMAIRGAGMVEFGQRAKTLDRRPGGVMGWRFGVTTAA